MSLTLICVYASAWARIPAHDFVCLCRLWWDSKKTTTEDDRACYCIYTPKLPHDKMQTGCCSEGESGNKCPHQRWLWLIPPTWEKSITREYICVTSCGQENENTSGGSGSVQNTETEADKDAAHSVRPAGNEGQLSVHLRTPQPLNTIFQNSSA